MDTCHNLLHSDTATATQGGGAATPTTSGTNTNITVKPHDNNMEDLGQSTHTSIHGGFIAITILIATILFIVYRIFAEQKKKLISKIGELNQTSQELCDKMKKLEKDNTQFNNQLIELKKQCDNAISRKGEKTANVGKSESSQIRENVIKPSTAEESTIRYGIFAVGESTDALTIENRDLSEEPSAWFKFNIFSDDKATYTINPNCMNEMLRDMEQLRLYTEKFVVPNSPTRIEEVVKGTLTKNGREWVVRKRLEIRVL